MSQQAQPTLPLDDLWGQRADDLGLRLQDSPVWPLVERLYEELAAHGLDFRPACYVANEWGCPDGQPLIGIPFYLVDPRLHTYEEEFADDLEEGERIMAGLRHEAGHAINYAFQLWNEPEWRETFGDFHARYSDDYQAEPFSRSFVRHLPGWYAQKHPDEDFAETFAVWLTPGPGIDWRQRYQGWEALRKLEYVDRAMRRIAGLKPVVDPSTVVPDPEELSFKLADFYHRRRLEDQPPIAELGTTLDDDLREIFNADAVGTDAYSVLDGRRRQMMHSISGHSGSRLYVVKSIIDFVAKRVRELGLRAAPGREADAVIGVTSLISTLTHTFLRTGHFHAPVAA